MGPYWVCVGAPVSENLDIFTFSQVSIFSQKEKIKKVFPRVFLNVATGSFPRVYMPPTPLPSERTTFPDRDFSVLA